MEKRRGIISYLVLIVLAVALVACAGSPQKSSTGDFVDDTVITTKVKSMLARDAFLSSFQIGVETFKGTVQLSGFVDSEVASARATTVALGVKGVRFVQNDLVVK